MEETFRPPADIREMMELVLFRNIHTWLPDGAGPKLNLGPGQKHIEGAVELDLPHWDADHDDIPYKTGSISTIYAIHFLEHVKQPLRVLRECQRVLRPGGHLNVGVPYYRSQAAVMDLDHKSFWCEDTWKNLFNNEYYEKNHDGWRFKIGTNLIFGIVERNMMLMTQLIKEG